MVLVKAPKILFTPNPPDQLDIRMPAAPAFSNAKGRERLSNPVLEIRRFQSLAAFSFSATIFSYSAGVAYSFQLYSGLPDGCNMEIKTNFPFTWGSHF